MIQFEHPLVLWAALGAIVPIIIHLFGNKTRKQTLIPSLMWLDELKSASRSNRKIKDWLVLIMRVLAVLFVVIALAKPVTTLELKKVQIDNYPANWSSKDIWLPTLIQGVESQSLEIYSRDGTYFGRASKIGAVDLIKTMSATTKPFYPVEGAELLSFGFSNPQKWSEPVHIVRRSPLNNTHVTYGFEDAEGLDFESKQESLWRCFKQGELFLEKRDSTFRLTSNTASMDTLVLLNYGDSIVEDNTFNVYNKPRKSSLVWVYDLLPQGATRLLSRADSVLYYDSSKSIDLNEFEVVFAFGFPFEPEVLSDFSGTLLFFPTQGDRIDPHATRPVLENNFYSTYFMGPSMRNKWPEISLWVGGAEEGTPLLRCEKGVAATLDRYEDQSVYRQYFVPEDWNHPYFKALLRWSGSNDQLKVEALSYLGLDSYDKWLSLNKERLVIHELTTDQGLKSLDFWSLQKFTLVIALFCALIALIFAKI